MGAQVRKDHLSGQILWYKFISGRETAADYREGVEWLTARGFRVRAVVCDGLKGLRGTFPKCKFQLCQFHQVMTVRARLTMHPKLPASRELLALALTLCRTDKKSFIGVFGEWEAKWADFLNERAEGADGRTHYVHKDLRGAYLSLKRNMPWLWTWYDWSELEIPNTHNALEALDSALKTKLNLHRGMNAERRKIFIQDFLKAHSPRR